MTNELKQRITDIIQIAFPTAGSSILLSVTNKIAEAVDKDVGKALMEGSNMGEILKATGLRLTSIYDKDHNANADGSNTAGF